MGEKSITSERSKVVLQGFQEKSHFHNHTKMFWSSIMYSMHIVQAVQIN